MKQPLRLALRNCLLQRPEMKRNYSLVEGIAISFSIFYHACDQCRNSKNRGTFQLETKQAKRRTFQSDHLKQSFHAPKLSLRVISSLFFCVFYKRSSFCSCKYIVSQNTASITRINNFPNWNLNPNGIQLL